MVSHRQKRGVHMAIISDIKCGRCDRRYSGFRSRCPYCGARRNKRGKHADESDNAKAKLIIGVLLLVVLISATMVLLFTGFPGQDGDGIASTTNTDSSLSDDANIDQVQNSDDGTQSPSPSPSPSPSAVITVESVVIVWAVDGQPKIDITLEEIGETEQFDFETNPEMSEEQATWESSNEDIFMVVDGKVTAIGKGSATLRCIVEGVTGTCIIRVRGT